MFENTQSDLGEEWRFEVFAPMGYSVEENLKKCTEIRNHHFFFKSDIFHPRIALGRTAIEI